VGVLLVRFAHTRFFEYGNQNGHIGKEFVQQLCGISQIGKWAV
jgi:hypothetical protein